MVKKIIILSTGVIFILSGIFFLLNSPPEYMGDEIIYIKKGESISSTAAYLKGKNLIRSSIFFKFLAVSQSANIIIGKYKIFKGMSSNEILKRLSKGDVLKREVTIPEGFNLYETGERLSDNSICGYNDFIKYAFDRDFLTSTGIFSSSAEGFLYPDTYIFAEGKNAGDIIIIMHNRMKEVLDSIDLSNLKSLNLNIDKLINLASLIEKEAKLPEERKYISAVFHNRLKRDIALYCDPTVRYAVKKFKGRITYNDLKVDSPFNTYRYKGLPPTPICSPGKDSIVAALNPAETNYLYFVAREDGSHYFSKTLKEHNRAVEFYQKGIDNGFIDDQEL